MMKALEILAHAGDDKCTTDTLFGLPHWGANLHFSDACDLVAFSMNDVWTVVANLIRIALGVAGYLAIIFIIVGGIMFIVSQGDPQRIQRAKSVITNAIVGLVVAVTASAVVGFIAGRF